MCARMGTHVLVLKPIKGSGRERLTCAVQTVLKFELVAVFPSWPPRARLTDSCEPLLWAENLCNGEAGFVWD